MADPVLPAAQVDGACSTNKSEPIVFPSKMGSVLEFWEKNKAVFPRLYAITRKNFCVPATSAGVERLFSIYGFVLGNFLVALMKLSSTM